jgi:hypothetical protein
MNLRSLLLEDVRQYDQAQESWRAAAGVVRDRWAQFVAADRSARSTTFAAYVAALDFEAAAADQLCAVYRSA